MTRKEYYKQRHIERLVYSSITHPSNVGKKTSDFNVLEAWDIIYHRLINTLTLRAKTEPLPKFNPAVPVRCRSDIRFNLTFVPDSWRRDDHE